MQPRDTRKILEGEIWKLIEGHGNYEVSNLGRVRTVAGLILMHNVRKYGYRTVNLKTDGRKKAAYVHILVAAAFVGPRPEGMEVNHKDLDPANCAADNLEYLTHRENIRHAIMERGGHWMSGKPATWARTRITRIDTDRGEKVKYPSIKAAVEVLNAMTVAAGGVARAYAGMAANICAARRTGGKSYGFAWK